jgi:hypothetical protein
MDQDRAWRGIQIGSVGDNVRRLILKSEEKEKLESRYLVSYIGNDFTKP